MAPSRAQNGHAAPADSSSPPVDEDEDFNPVHFQANLDDALASARSLVEGWIPQGLGPEWGSSGAGQTAQQGVQALKDRARLPRLGLGASPAAVHQQRAEDRKLAKQLGVALPSSSTYGSTSTPAATSKAGTGAEGDVEADEESSEDEEESRTRAVGKGKTKAVNGFNGAMANGKGKGAAWKAAKQAPNNPFVLHGTSSSSTSTPAKATSTSASASPSATTNGTSSKPLFNAPSPSKPSASSSSSAPPAAASSSSASVAKPGLSSSAFYSPTIDKPDLCTLSKNQRKKLREKEAKLALKRQAEEESRAEHEGALSGTGAKRARTDEPAREEADQEMGEPEGEAPEADGEPTEGSASPEKGDAAGAEGGEAGAAKKRKKKKRKSKGGANGAGEGAGEPLLNLG
ncbi:hypothetical protein JCM8097_000718 [Rhodosporidiobolus ruineniae]